MTKVLFVCLGNICRSPMAEAVFRHMVKEAGAEGEISCDSVGTAGYHVGERPHKGTLAILSEMGVGSEGIRARKLEKKDVKEFDFIVAMDDSNLADIKRMAGKEWTHKLFKLSDFVEKGDWDHVPDPWYTGDFQETYRLVKEGCEHLLERIRRQGGFRGGL